MSPFTFPLSCGFCKNIVLPPCVPITFNPLAHNESLKCERLKFQKDRKRPDSCHPFHPEENAMECGSAATLSPTLVAAVFPILTFFISR
ncbi:hypothetical protein SRHO_G00268010 [Serrasalmus rhombeus]